MVKEGASILATDPNADNLPIGIRTGFIVDRYKTPWKRENTVASS